MSTGNVLGSSGASNRIFNLSAGLSACGATVYVFHQGKTLSLNANLKFMNFQSVNFMEGSGNYLHPFNPFFPFKFHRFLKKYSPTIIQCEQPWSTLPTVLLSQRLGIPCVLDEHNFEYLWSKESSRVPFLSMYTKIIEKFACTKSSAVLATSNVDKFKINRIFGVPKNKIIVIPNGVSVQSFSKITQSKTDLRRKLGLNPYRKIVLFHGTMSAKQNYDAAKIIVDLIAPKINALFLIIGKNPPLWLCNSVQKQNNVHIMGFVANLEEYILASDVCIIPLRNGSGTRLKIVEYLAAGKPIVSTDIGAEGLPIDSGVHALLFKDVTPDFIAAVKRLLDDNKLGKELGLKSRELAEQLRWEKITRSLYTFYRQNFEDSLDHN